MKMNKSLSEIGIAKLSITIVLVVVLILAVTVVVAAASDEKCYKLASAKDNLVQNFFNEPILERELNNPCTNTYMIADIYEDYDDHVFSRIVFENGDVYGFTGAAKYISTYILCSDGRAEVKITTIQNVEGNAWGLWSKSPMSRNNYEIEQCSSL